MGMVMAVDARARHKYRFQNGVSEAKARLAAAGFEAVHFYGDSFEKSGWEGVKIARQMDLAI
jgi:hypothetical protein